MAKISKWKIALWGALATIIIMFLITAYGFATCNDWGCLGVVLLPFFFTIPLFFAIFFGFFYGKKHKSFMIGIFAALCAFLIAGLLNYGILMLFAMLSWG